MHYKRLILLLHLVNWGGLLLVYINFVFWSSSDPAFYLFIAGILYFILLASIPAILEKQKQILVARFGSREEQDLQEHVAELFFKRLLSGRIVAQLDPRDEGQMVAFAEGLKGMYGEEVASRVQDFYPDLTVDRIDAFLDTCVKIGKTVMSSVFYPEKRRDADLEAATARLAGQYPFLSPAQIRRIYRWWQAFRDRLEQRARMAGG